MEKKAKKKTLAPIRDWIKSIKYHLYWCVMSSPQGDGAAIKKKWLSCVEHIQDKHDNCLHGDLGQQRKWLNEGTQASDDLVAMLTKTLLVNDISKMSAIGQTSGVESYHSVLNHFAPKMIKFSYSGMNSRICLAALHYNENAGRPQAATMAGEGRYRIDFPKYKTGGYVVKKILVGATYGKTNHLHTMSQSGSYHFTTIMVSLHLSNN
ncbi:uncharacterized protein LOC135496551 [Lineus longissimus]|uniref:uncharacterized protein LOC135496551 n=1 Tax=Lineus longissimus TaxID=88925 RepID=UPI00315D96D0